MRTYNELHEILKGYSIGQTDAHIHTYLCDGAKDMTVENIAKAAEDSGMKLIILTPHFHKCVSDDTATLYTDTDENILIRLREEIDDYEQKNGKVKILLSTEADILKETGEMALDISPSAEDALDLVTPTVNYHPLLPLKAVEVTYGRCIEEMHKSGLYKKYADGAGGIENILQSLYRTEVNAIKNAKYPVILGHFLAAHSYAVGEYNWFGAEPSNIKIIKDGAEEVVKACAETGAMIDITGIHFVNMTVSEKQKADGFFFDFQKWFMKKCKEYNVIALPGTDSHGLSGIGKIEYYKELI